jgi:hypothetical protein
MLLTPSIWDICDYLEKTLVCMMCKFKFVWLVHRVEGFKMEQKTAMKFCVKLNKTAAETVKSVYDEECVQ